MSFFKFYVTGLETIDLDYLKETADIGRYSSSALQTVGAEMIENLQKHIQEDWYGAWKPPKVYERRTDDPSLGTPLGSKENMDASVSGMELDFTYEPNGEHKVAAWSGHRSGDGLINVIQTNSGWTWKPKGAGKRPFWNNFVDEEFNGQIMETFITAMSGQYKVEPDGTDLLGGAQESKLAE